MAFLVPSIAIVAGTQVGERLASRIGARATLLAGFVIGAAGTGSLAFAFGVGFGYAVPGLLVGGLGHGMVWTAMFVAAGSGVAATEQGVAGGMATSTLNIGNAAGLAALTALAGTRHTLLDGGSLAVLAAAVGMIGGLLVALALPREKFPVASEVV